MFFVLRYTVEDASATARFRASHADSSRTGHGGKNRQSSAGGNQMGLADRRGEQLVGAGDRGAVASCHRGYVQGIRGALNGNRGTTHFRWSVRLRGDSIA